MSNDEPHTHQFYNSLEHFKLPKLDGRIVGRLRFAQTLDQRLPTTTRRWTAFDSRPPSLRLFEQAMFSNLTNCARPYRPKSGLLSAFHCSTRTALKMFRGSRLPGVMFFFSVLSIFLTCTSLILHFSFISSSSQAFVFSLLHACVDVCERCFWQPAWPYLRRH